MLLPPSKSTVTNQELHAHVTRAQERQKKGHDKTTRTRKPFFVGDSALLKVNILTGAHTKMVWKPAKVIQALGDMYYQVLIEIDQTTRKAHINQLREGRYQDLSERTAKRRGGESQSVDDMILSSDEDIDSERAEDHQEQIQHSGFPRRSQRVTKGKEPDRYGDWDYT
jgi:hypothetical protein